MSARRRTKKKNLPKLNATKQEGEGRSFESVRFISRPKTSRTNQPRLSYAAAAAAATVRSTTATSRSRPLPRHATEETEEENHLLSNDTLTATVTTSSPTSSRQAIPSPAPSTTSMSQTFAVKSLPQAPPQPHPSSAASTRDVTSEPDQPPPQRPRDAEPEPEPSREVEIAMTDEDEPEEEGEGAEESEAVPSVPEVVPSDGVSEFHSHSPSPPSPKTTTKTNPLSRPGSDCDSADSEEAVAATGPSPPRSSPSTTQRPPETDPDPDDDNVDDDVVATFSGPSLIPPSPPSLLPPSPYYTSPLPPPPLPGPRPQLRQRRTSTPPTLHLASDSDSDIDFNLELELELDTVPVRSVRQLLRRFTMALDLTEEEGEGELPVSVFDGLWVSYRAVVSELRKRKRKRVRRERRSHESQSQTQIEASENKETKRKEEHETIETENENENENEESESQSETESEKKRIEVAAATALALRADLSSSFSHFETSLSESFAQMSKGLLRLQDRSVSLLQQFNAAVNRCNGKVNSMENEVDSLYETVLSSAVVATPLALNSKQFGQFVRFVIQKKIVGFQHQNSLFGALESAVGICNESLLRFVEGSFEKLSAAEERLGKAANSLKKIQFVEMFRKPLVLRLQTAVSRHFRRKVRLGEWKMSLSVEVRERLQRKKNRSFRRVLRDCFPDSTELSLRQIPSDFSFDLTHVRNQKLILVSVLRLDQPELFSHTNNTNASLRSLSLSLSTAQSSFLYELLRLERSIRIISVSDTQHFSIDKIFLFAQWFPSVIPSRGTHKPDRGTHRNSLLDSVFRLPVLPHALREIRRLYREKRLRFHCCSNVSEKCCSRVVVREWETVERSLKSRFKETQEAFEALKRTETEEPEREEEEEEEEEEGEVDRFVTTAPAAVFEPVFVPPNDAEPVHPPETETETEIAEVVASAHQEEEEGEVDTAEPTTASDDISIAVAETNETETETETEEAETVTETVPEPEAEAEPEAGIASSAESNSTSIDVLEVPQNIGIELPATTRDDVLQVLQGCTTQPDSFALEYFSSRIFDLDDQQIELDWLLHPLNLLEFEVETEEGSLWSGASRRSYLRVLDLCFQRRFPELRQYLLIPRPRDEVDPDPDPDSEPDGVLPCLISIEKNEESESIQVVLVSHLQLNEPGWIQLISEETELELETLSNSQLAFLFKLLDLERQLHIARIMSSAEESAIIEIVYLFTPWACAQPYESARRVLLMFDSSRLLREAMPMLYHLALGSQVRMIGEEVVEDCQQAQESVKVEEEEESAEARLQSRRAVANSVFDELCASEGKAIGSRKNRKKGRKAKGNRSRSKRRPRKKGHRG